MGTLATSIQSTVYLKLAQIFDNATKLGRMDALDILILIYRV